MSSVPDMIADLQRLARLIEDAAPVVAGALERAVKAQIAAGTDPDGVAWEPTREGVKPLRHAGGALKVVTVGPSVLLQVTGPEARHSTGRVKGGKVRRILPAGKLPRSYARAIKAALDRAVKGPRP